MVHELIIFIIHFGKIAKRYGYWTKISVTGSMVEDGTCEGQYYTPLMVKSVYERNG